MNIFAERIGGSIQNFESKNGAKIWLNYKLLEAELERVNLEKYIHDRIFSKELNILDKICTELARESFD